MNNRMILDKYTQPIYVPKDLYVCVNPNFNKLKTLFKFSDDYDIERDFEGSNGMTFYLIKNVKEDRLCILVILNMKSLSEYDTDQAINTIAHEAFHVAHETLNYCGVEFTANANETYAYFIGWAAQCIYKTYIKTKK